MRVIMIAVLIVMLVGCAVQAANQPVARGKVETVTLYRGQALVTRVVPFDAPAGAVQLRVTDLPESVLQESVFASGAKDVRIRAVRYRVTAVEKAPEQKVRDLDDRIAAVEKEIRENEEQQRLVRRLDKYLDNLEGFVAPTAKIEMTKGVLNAGTLEKVMGMMFDKRAEHSKKTLELAETARGLKQKQSLLQRRRYELTRSHTKVSREAIVFLDKVGRGRSEIRLNYLVRNATWEPAYNLRSSGDMTSVTVEYSALAQQMTGEDWDDVKLTLSTAAAQMIADGPVLAPLWVTLSRSPSRYLGIADTERRMKQSRMNLQRAQEALQRTVKRDGQIDQQWEMNKAATSAQGLELTARSHEMFLVRKILTESKAGLSVNYKLEGAVSLASRRESQMVEIQKLKLPAKFYYEAAPLLSEYVYRYAQLTNNSKLSLLEGRSNVYLDGDFVGTGTVSMVARGQKLTVGFGIEPQLRAWREFVSKKEHVQGGNRNITFKYRLVLDNYSDKAITVRSLDRIPVPKADIKVTLGEFKDDKLSADVEYLRAFRPQGILRWDVSVPAKSAAAKAKIVAYSYTLEFDRTLHIAGDQPATASAQQKRAFYDQLKAGR